jgi:hypothetical protein
VIPNTTHTRMWSVQHTRTESYALLCRSADEVVSFCLISRAPNEIGGPLSLARSKPRLEAFHIACTPASQPCLVRACREPRVSRSLESQALSQPFTPIHRVLRATTPDSSSGAITFMMRKRNFSFDLPKLVRTSAPFQSRHMG